MAPVLLVTGLPALSEEAKYVAEELPVAEPALPLLALDICATAARRVEETRSSNVGDQPPVADALPEQLTLLTFSLMGA